MQVETIHVVIVAASSVIGAFGGGFAIANRRNGYIKRSECVTNIDNIYNKINEVDNKVNNVKGDTEYIRGKLDRDSK